MHTAGCTNATRLGGRRELMSCGSGDASVEDHRSASDDKRCQAAPRGGRVQGAMAPRAAGSERSGGLDGAEHGGMLTFMSEAGHHASDTNLSMLFNDFIW